MSTFSLTRYALPPFACLLAAFAALLFPAVTLAQPGPGTHQGAGATHMRRRSVIRMAHKLAGHFRIGESVNRRKVYSNMPIDKYHLNLAGEYRACSELLKRGIFATVTYGNMKGCDVVAVGLNRLAAVIEVKTSQTTRFVTSFYQKYKTPELEHPTFWVLYSIRPDGDTFVERFFVLSHAELADVQAERNHSGDSSDYAVRAARVSNGVDNVLVKNVEEHEDAWYKIVQWCSQPTESHP